MRLLSEVDPSEFDWRDPDMPVIRHATNFERQVQVVLSSWENQQVANQCMAEGESPSWRNDPTYNMRRRKR
jgi:hypothetical protein